MKCYRDGGCGPYEMYSCADCPASRPEYATRWQGKDCPPYMDNPRERKIETNGDHVRAMSDEKLAHFLAVKMANVHVLQLADEGVPVSKIQRQALIYRLKNAWLSWLREPAEEVAGE